jgi:putative component of membrane protein insertase Oxa1/YidC/SpoIIIJ protein YidD
MLLRWLALAGIHGYQRWISPYKGFQCAYRLHTGCASCSALGHRVIRRFGVWNGLPLLRERMARCGAVHEAHRRQQADLVAPGAVAAAEAAMAHRRPPAAQRGDCDLGCGPDLPCDGHPGCAGCDGPAGPRGDGCGCGISPRTVCNYANCCDCGGCDWPGREKKKGASRYADRHGLRQRRS